MKLEREGIQIIPESEQKTGLWDMAFVWFCANVAVPRLLMGGSMAGLGFARAAAMLLWGNVLVILPLLALGVIGYKVRIPTMAAARMTFGIKGSYVPAIANAVQLIGWGASVTVVCGSSIDAVVSAMTGYSNITLWIILTGIVQLLITAYGFRSITWLQRVSVPLLALLSIYAAYLMIKNYGWSNLTAFRPESPMPIMLGIDVLAANAFAWGPMVCDYTRYAKNKSSSSVGTLIGSLAGAAGFMFVGMISSIVTGDPNPSSMLVSLGLGVPALLIIILSSVTTNVMNLYSSAISFVNVFPKIEPWKIIVGGGVAITGVAVIPNLIGHFIQFLTIVGSIFVPLIAILLVDYFLLKKQQVDAEQLLVDNASSSYWYKNGFNVRAIVIWLVCVAIFNILPHVAPTIGATVPTFLLIAVVYFAVEKLSPRKA